MPVNSRCPAYKAMEPKWTRCYEVYEGQDAIHAAGERYLPKLSEQSPDEYNAMVSRATFYNATYRTIIGLVGMIFRQPPTTDFPAGMEEMMEDVTMSGVPLHMFAQKVTTEALKVGRIGVLVDYPSVDANAVTMADAQKLNLRPVMHWYSAGNIINWRTGVVNNKNVLTMVVLEECVAVPKDEFEEGDKKQWRVLDLDPKNNVYRVRLFERTNDKDVQIGGDLYPIMNGKPLTYIPFIFIGSDDITPAVDDPPLIDLVNVNISHYKTTADLEHGAHFTGLPTPIVSGYKKGDPSEKLYIGSASAWLFPDPETTATFLEFSGQGLEALEKRLEIKEQQMAVLGARMLEPQKAAVETAESESIHRKGEESQLASVSMCISLGLETALKWFAEWASFNPETVSFSLNRDFFPVKMSPQMLTSLVGAWQTGAITKETLFDNLQQADIIAQDTTFEEEEAKMEDEPPALTAQLKIAESTPAPAAGEEDEPKPGEPPAKKAA